MYNVTAYAPPVPLEEFITDNIATKIVLVRSGIRYVVFEEAHLSLYTIGSNLAAYYPPGGYAEFANYLIANGYIVSTINPGTTIDLNVLAPLDVLVIVAPQNSYSVSEIDAIEAWVKGGGGLLLITDWDDFGLQASTIAARFGIAQRFDGICDYDENTGSHNSPYYDGENLLVHPVTAGVARIEMCNGDGITSAPADEIPLIVTDSDGTATWYRYPSPPALGVSVMSALDGGTAGSGRLIIITDSNVWDSVNDIDNDGDIDFYDSDNEILALNSVSWLLPTVHDVAVTDVKPYKTVVGQGYTTNINVTVANQGDYTETFNVTIYVNTTAIASQNVTLTSGSSPTITFTWNTTTPPVDKGNYTISAKADLHPPEIDDDPSDNIYIDGIVTVAISGDVNGDKIVNVSDLYALSKAYNSTPTSLNWNPNADINNDFIINTLDLEILSKNYGKSWSAS
jgi:hypothetical protein